MGAQRELPPGIKAHEDMFGLAYIALELLHYMNVNIYNLPASCEQRM